MDEAKRLTEKQIFWRDHLKACEAQGMSLSAYAQAQGLKLQSLYDWKWRLGKLGLLACASEGDRFVAVQVEPPAVERGVCRVHLTNGVCVELDVSLSEATMRAVLRTANEMP